ncbi:MAG: tetratricopeptide repeat protein [Phycisphaerae bacterium]
MVKLRLSTAAALCFLVIAAEAVGVDPPSMHAIQKVRRQSFEVDYELDPGSAAVESVHLWYTTDGGRSWRNYGVDVDGISPFSFNAGEQGLYGFYIVAFNAAGGSGPTPGPTTEPHYWAYVDFTPPVVQLHRIGQDRPPTVPQTLHIRWSALDNSLASRPIELSYQTVPDGPWRAIAGPLTNAGSYDWRVPADFDKPIRIRITVRDRCGHIVEATSPPTVVERPAPAAPQPRSRNTIASKSREARLTGLVGDDTLDHQTRALKLYQQGKLHSMRGEYRLAASRLRDSLALDPTLLDALVALGEALYAQGEPAKSVEAFQLALDRRPGSRDALQGLALAYIGERRFTDAVQQLSRIVQANPQDAKAWLNLGDIAIYQGDELLAGEHYQRALTRNPGATETIARARLRMADLKRLAAEFRQNEPVR